MFSDANSQNQTNLLISNSIFYYKVFKISLMIVEENKRYADGRKWGRENR